jgi:hypothetical protein
MLCKTRCLILGNEADDAKEREEKQTFHDGQ